MPPGRTQIKITVVGCDGCRVQPIQNKNSSAAYYGHSQTAHGDPTIVTFLVPTSRTAKMAFLVYAPFDEAAQNGTPAVAVIGYAGKQPGTEVGAVYAATPRPASGCWAGTHQARVTETLEVRPFRTTDPLLGPGKHTVASVHFTRTLRSLPFYYKVHGNALHASDPSICK